MSGRILGRVVGMWRYPVKSMAGEKLAHANVGWYGFAGDRRWAFVREAHAGNSFPWLTMRRWPELVLYRPRFVQPDSPESSQTIVRTPAGFDFDVGDPMLAREFGEGVRVIKQHRGVFDTMPLSIITTQSVNNFSKLTGVDLDPLRFRPNILVEAESEGDFPEDDWLTSVVRIGAISIRVDRRDKRCVVVNYDPHTADRDRNILATVVRERDVWLGVLGSTVTPGRIEVGDAVTLEPAT